MYKYYESIHSDENQEIINLSDHNLITVNLNISGASESHGKKAEWRITEYHKTDEESLKKYTLEVETRNISSITDFNTIVKDVTDANLKGIYRRKTQQRQDLHEPPWITDEIRVNSKKRKEYNRNKRRAIREEERHHWENLFQAQKKITQNLIKEKTHKGNK